MIILRRLFSEEDQDKKSNKTRNSLVAAGGLLSADIGIHQLNDKLGRKLGEDWKKQAKDKESQKVYNRLKKNFKKSGKAILQEGIDSSGNIIHQSQSGIDLRSGNKIVQLSGKTRGNASILGHELGHLHYLSNPKADKVGKYAHKLRPISDNSTLIGLGAGIVSGVRSAKKEEKGEKEGIVNRSLGILASTGANIPRLVAEGKASQHGYKLLKKAGASKRLLNSAKGNYKKAFLTYGTGIVGDIGISELGRAAGRAYYNNVIKEDKKDDNPKK